MLRVCRLKLAIICFEIKFCLSEHIDFKGTVELAQCCGVREMSHLGGPYNGSTLLHLEAILLGKVWKRRIDS
jgi:hypothetical protein